MIEQQLAELEARLNAKGQGDDITLLVVDLQHAAPQFIALAKAAQDSIRGTHAECVCEDCMDLAKALDSLSAALPSAKEGKS